MDLTIYVQSGGMSAAFALSLDVLPHQLTAIAHVTSILQMCSMYAESRPSQQEAHQQLKSYMDKVNFIQTQLVNKQKRRTSAKRGVKPMPVILDSKGDYEQSGNGNLSDEESTVRPIAQQRQKARTAPAAESDPPDEDSRPYRGIPDPSPRGSSINSSSLEDIPSDLMFGSGRQATDDVNWDKKADDDNKAETVDVAENVNPSPPKSAAHLLSTSFRWRVPAAPVSWMWSKKSARIVPDEKTTHSLDQAAALVPCALLE